MGHSFASLSVVYAKFLRVEQQSFPDLITGFTSLRVLTYSGSIKMLRNAAKLVNDIEVVFGREDAVKGADEWFSYINYIRNEVRDETKVDVAFETQVYTEAVRILVGRSPLIRHEKVYLLTDGTRIFELNDLCRAAMGVAGYPQEHYRVNL